MNPKWSSSIRDHFPTEVVYFDSATMGLTPVAANHEMKVKLDEIAQGRCNALEFDACIERSRESFGRIVRAPIDWISIIPAVSIATSVLSSNLSMGQRVLVAEEDFTSVLFPLLQARERGVEVEVVPLESLIDRMGEHIDWIAVSAVQSSDGRKIDLDTLAEACSQYQVRSYIDLTQAAGWMEIDAARFDITATGAYKWLLCPRGTGFMTVRPELWNEMEPVAPGWYAGEYPWDSIYSPPLRLADNARRFDISPAWVCWAGAAPALELIAAIGPKEIGAHNTHLASVLCEAIGSSNEGSAIVSLQLSEQNAQSARARQFVFSGRGGRSRFSFHLYNTIEEVESTVEFLRGI